MIIVLDTNVLISALLSSKGSPAEIIQRWEAEQFEVATSPPLLKELERALQYEQVRKYLQLSDAEIRNFLRLRQATSILVEAEIRLDVVEADPDDNRELECAVAAGATYIETGDKHLLDLKEYEGIVILPPVGFITILNLEK